MNAIFYLTPKSSVVYLNGNATIRQSLDKMKRHGYTAVPVIDKEGKYIGSLSEGNLLWFIYDIVRNGSADFMADIEKIPIENIIDRDRHKAVKVDVSFNDLVTIAKEQNFVPVTDDRGIFIGIVTRRTLMDKMEN